jgi:hypothetical protein
MCSLSWSKSFSTGVEFRTVGRELEKVASIRDAMGGGI